MGTQRDLSPKHAKDAYAYVKNTDMAFWPEVFLAVRNRNIITLHRLECGEDIVQLNIDIESITNSEEIHISRVDGNHRLHYAGGELTGYPPIEKTVSFCLAYDISLQQEITLFRDINDNQRRMNTSHLDNISTRLTPEEAQKRKDPPLYIAKKLGEDEQSVLYQRVYEGGKKPGGFMVPLRTLKTGIQYMLSRPTKLSALQDPDAQYQVIRNYFEAVKAWQPEAWIKPNQYLVLRGAGLWGICFIGADVIDRTLSDGKFHTSDMLGILISGNDIDWSKDGDFAGYSGRGGAVKIRDYVVKGFEDKSGVSIESLAKRILSS